VGTQYLFAFPNPETGNNQPGTTTNFVGHCTQNAFVFGNTVVTGLPDDWPPSSNRVEALRMASFMSERWANLAKYGDPNGQSSEAKASSSSSSSSSSIPRWESYSKAKDEAFVFGNTVATSGMRLNKKAQCDFLRWCRGNQSGHGSIGSPGMPGQPCTPIAAK
jgi:carboxylesterase type B